MAMGLSHAFETRYRQRSLQAVQFMRTKASGHPSWPGVTDSTEGRIHWRRPTAIEHFSLATLRRTIHSDKRTVAQATLGQAAAYTMGATEFGIGHHLLIDIFQRPRR